MKADIGLVSVWVHTTDVGKPPDTHGRTKLNKAVSQKQVRILDYKTYTSTLASSSSSRAISLVGPGGVPHGHLEVLDQERTDDLVQDIEQEMPATH